MAYLAIDIGGTSIKAGLVSAEGRLLHHRSEPTSKVDYETLLDQLKALFIWGTDLMSVEGIAISQPCATISATGMSVSEGALGYIKGQNPARDLGAWSGLPYAGENDGNCAALAEVWLGSAMDVSDMAFVVCGTGIGGALVKDRKIHGGLRQFSGEFGMCVLGWDQEKNSPITWSDSGSTAAMVADYHRRSGSNLTAPEIFDLADSGDSIAQQTLDDFFMRFAIGLHNIQHVYDPQRILIGGGISAREDLVSRIERALDQLYSQFDYVVSRPVISVCTFGAEANLIGAVYHLGACS